MILAQNWPKTAKSSWRCSFKERYGFLFMLKLWLFFSEAKRNWQIQPFNKAQFYVGGHHSFHKQQSYSSDRPPFTCLRGCTCWQTPCEAQAQDSRYCAGHEWHVYHKRTEEQTAKCWRLGVQKDISYSPSWPLFGLSHNTILPIVLRDLPVHGCKEDFYEL